MVSFYGKLLPDSASKILDFASKIITSKDRGFQEQINFIYTSIITWNLEWIAVNNYVLALYNYILEKNIK